MQEGNTPLHIASLMGNEEILRALLLGIEDADESITRTLMNHFMFPPEPKRVRYRSHYASFANSETENTDWQSEFVKEADADVLRMVKQYAKSSKVLHDLLGATNRVRRT